MFQVANPAIREIHINHKSNPGKGGGGGGYIKDGTTSTKIHEE